MNAVQASLKHPLSADGITMNQAGRLEAGIPRALLAFNRLPECGDKRTLADKGDAAMKDCISRTRSYEAACHHLTVG